MCVCVNKKLSGVQMSRPVEKAILSMSPENSFSSSNSSRGSFNSRNGGGRRSGGSCSKDSYNHSRITCSNICVAF